MDTMKYQETDTVSRTNANAGAEKKRSWSAPQFITAEIAEATEITLSNVFDDGIIFS